MTRSWLFAPALLLAVSGLARAQQPESTVAEAKDSDVEALRTQIRQRWHEHIRQTLGLSDEQAAKVQGTEDRFEQQRMQYRTQLRDINRRLNGEMLAERPNNDNINDLIRQRQETRLSLEQVDRDQDREMAGYLSPMQRVRYQQEVGRLRALILDRVRQRQGGGMVGPRPFGGRGGGGGGMRPREGGGQQQRPRRRP
jgi:Spy/CpxP family protein refolding chaperone